VIPVVSAHKLKELLERAKGDAGEDPAFLRALLDAQIYAHVPRSKRLYPWRFMQFRRREGIMVVPCFSTEKKAKRASGSVARVIAMTGRQFLESTLGSTVILDPEDTPCCVLYPEEIASLLDEGYVARVQSLKLDEGAPPVCKLEPMPVDLIDLLVPVLGELPFVDVAYIAGLAWKDLAGCVTPLVVLGGDSKLAERAARAVTTVLQRQSSKFQTVVDLAHFDTRGVPPPWIGELKLTAIYRRTQCAPTSSAIGKGKAN